eukprot:TRINITY_DN12235_c0_g1_i1.p3 TRINITY_DN12235_c0_g1~~TRINITY_DN12235_c0_g1_i1.p3  ORF type:complete len:203 (+),score=27.23 TRINITY_DN12235_c0_g1_i1:1-609(+)
MLQLGVSPDVISYSCVMEAYNQRGQIGTCINLFAELQSNVSDPIYPDIYSRSALVGILAKAEKLERAQEGVQRIVEISKQEGKVPPIQAFGALIYGYGKSLNINKAVDTLRWFLSEGGQPDQVMFEYVVELCLRFNKFKQAQQIVRVMKLMNVDLDKSEYQSMVDRVSRQANWQKGDGNLGAMERFKWWLGLPNKLYSSDWP